MITCIVFSEVKPMKYGVLINLDTSTIAHHRTDALDRILISQAFHTAL